MTIQEEILQILQKTQEIRLHDLVEQTGASRQMLHRAMKDLVLKGIVQKIGSPPKTYYRLLPRPTKSTPHKIIKADQDFLDEHFLQVTEVGKELRGLDAMAWWCNRQKLPIEKTVAEFISTRRKYLGYYLPNGLISGLGKLRSTRGLGEIGLDEVYYLDFYAIERFGKTRLGLMLHLAKQGQNRNLMNQIISLINDRVKKLTDDLQVDAVGFIPPTIKREVQFMKVLEKKLNLPLPHLKLVKVSGDIVIPQKALSRIDERVTNAQSSIMVSERRQFKSVLLIDDAIGSGATINETALKLKHQSIASHVTGLAVTGSFKGFDVIQEV